MNKKGVEMNFRVLVYIALSSLVFGSTGCAKKCVDSTSTCGAFEACCTRYDCYYTYNSKRYDCDGKDCTDAAKRLAADMCGTAKRLANEPSSVTEQEALNKIKTMSETHCVTCP